MAGSGLFIKNGFEIADQAPPDFMLMAKKFGHSAAMPKFKGQWSKRLRQHDRGLTIIRADQCPYTVKNVREICQAAQKTYGLEAKVVDLKNCQEAQNSPNPFGTFCIIYQGNVIAHHPISSTRFTNIMNKMLR
jgi:hypothetical protein